MSRPDVVLVAIPREAAEAWARPDLSAGLDSSALADLDRASGQIHDAVVAALDTDREELGRGLAAQIRAAVLTYRAAPLEPWASLSDAEREPWNDAARAVLDLLEGGQE